jgi:hypothetical protein
MAPSTNPVATADLPDCFNSNYDAQQNLFTMKNSAQDLVNQQCMLTIGPRSRFGAGSYEVSLANGGGGGAGGTPQRGSGTGGGAGGGGAGAKEVVTRIDLAEGSYKLTIGAGGPGGNACVFAPYYMSGGPGWAGSPSSMVRIATGDVVAGTSGADSYARPSRAQHDRSSGLMDGHGGSGPGQTSGGHGGTSDSVTGVVILAESGQGSRPGAGGSSGANEQRWLAGGGGGPTRSGDSGSVAALSNAGFDAPTGRIGRTDAASAAGGKPGEDSTSAGGGGGGTSRGDGGGGGGGGENPGQPNHPPERGSLGSGGGGGEGSRFECDAGARGGHGYIALRPI